MDGHVGNAPTIPVWKTGVCLSTLMPDHARSEFVAAGVGPLQLDFEELEPTHVGSQGSRRQSLVRNNLSPGCWVRVSLSSSAGKTKRGAFPPNIGPQVLLAARIGFGRTAAMKFIVTPFAPRLPRVVVVAVWLSVSALSQRSTAQGIDPNLRLGIRHANQNVILNWFGSDAVAYQVESSTNLAAWANSSLVLTGKGALLQVTNPTAGQSRRFYRVKRLPPPQVITASFDPGTGILTIVGDNLDNVIAVSRNAAGAILVNGGTHGQRSLRPSFSRSSLFP